MCNAQHLMENACKIWFSRIFGAWLKTHVVECTELTRSTLCPAQPPSAISHTDQLFSSCLCSPSIQPLLAPVRSSAAPQGRHLGTVDTLQPSRDRGGHVTEDKAVRSVQESAMRFWAPGGHVQLYGVDLVPLQALHPHHGKQWQHCSLCFKWVFKGFYWWKVDDKKNHIMV